MRSRLRTTVPGASVLGIGPAIAPSVARSASRRVESAFRLAGPRPTACALVLAFGNGARARRASDGKVSTCDERMLRDAMAREVFGHVGLGEVGDGMDADEVAVLFEDRDVRA